MSTCKNKLHLSHTFYDRITKNSTHIFVSIPKYKYSYKCISHNFYECTTIRIIVSIPKYKYKYTSLYSCLIIVKISKYTYKYICKYL